MWIVDAAVIGAGWLVFVLLLWRCYKERHWSHYPLFSVYLVFTFLRAIAVGIFNDSNQPLYSIIYWYSDLLVVLLRFCVAWEIFRNAFPVRTVLRAIATRVLLVLLTALAVTFYFLAEPQGNFFLDLERKAGLTVVVWLAALLLLARFYNVPMGRNIWGMAVGMGLYVSISIANFSAFDLNSSFFFMWRFLTPVSFLAMTLIWTWALWTYAPAPQLQPVSGPPLHAAQKRWQLSWRKMISAIRKGLGR